LNVAGDIVRHFASALCLGFPRLLTLNLKTFGFYIPITQFVRL